MTRISSMLRLPATVDVCRHTRSYYRRAVRTSRSFSRLGLHYFYIFFPPYPPLRLSLSRVPSPVRAVRVNPSLLLLWHFTPRHVTFVYHPPPPIPDDSSALPPPNCFYDCLTLFGFGNEQINNENFFFFLHFATFLRDQRGKWRCFFVVNLVWHCGGEIDRVRAESNPPWIDNFKLLLGVPRFFVFSYLFED